MVTQLAKQLPSGEPASAIGSGGSHMIAFAGPTNILRVSVTPNPRIAPVYFPGEMLLKLLQKTGEY